MVSVSISDLRKSYGDATILPQLNLTIEDGEFVTLLGPSGCGKTTTLRCVAGLERASGGEIRFGDKLVSGRGTFVPPDKRKLGMVFQSYALWPHMTVFGNVSYPLRTARVPRAERPARVKEALERVGLAHMASRSVGTLSGGQQQRVALARAIVGRPQLILFDEPLSNLDAKLRSTMRTELQLLHRRLGTTSMYVTHDQTEAMTLSDRVVVMSRGEIQQVGTPEQVYSAPTNPFVADFVGFENILTTTAVSISGSRGAVRLGDGSVIEGRVMESIAEGQHAQAAFRANAVEVEARSDAKAVVLAATFLGDQREFLVDLGGQQVRVRVDVHSPSATSIRAGDRVALRPRSEAVLIYAGEAAVSTSTVAIGSLAASN
ncbi:ABC transporter ATP-binding protein [Microbacterium sp. NPDC077184]|uniref:ABC transporter ATP-binding protein n=1 Tax=Microbacterium sp. NPDC077184 TaxID=3154764 RepID=UPI0034439FEA